MASVRLPSAMWAAIRAAWADSCSGSTRIGGARDVDGAAVVTTRGQQLAELLQRVDAQLAVPFAVEQQPLLVPSGQQVGLEQARGAGDRLVVDGELGDDAAVPAR